MGVEIHKGIISPALDKLSQVSNHRLGSEFQHVAVREALHIAETNPQVLRIMELIAHKEPRLSVNLGGIELEGSPLMVGAGWDKAGKAVRALNRLGFSGVEIGSVLAFPQKGNDKPRQFMVGPGVALNRLGFNSPGMNVVAENLQRYEKGKDGVIGISLGKNKEIPNDQAPMAHALVAEALAKFASYMVINVSSPNTPGLRSLQEKGPLRDNTQAVKSTLERLGIDIPVLLKISPELSDEATMDVIEVAVDEGCFGIITTNTLATPEAKSRYGRDPQEPGGISGNDPGFRKMAQNKAEFVYTETKAQLKVIGVGGINDARTAWDRMTHGASALQVVTAIRGEGLGVAGKINKGLIKMMDERGVVKIEEIIGQEARRFAA